LLTALISPIRAPVAPLTLTVTKQVWVSVLGSPSTPSLRAARLHTAAAAPPRVRIGVG